MTQYPGQDPDDPFAKPPNESGQQQGSEETGPVTPAPPPTPPPPPADQPQTTNPWAGYDVPAGQAPPPAPPAYSQPGQPPPPPPGYPQAYPAGYPQGYAMPPNHPQATTVLVLGIVSLVCCGIAGPFAWVMGGRARREIRESQGQIGGDGQVTAGWIMGIIATVLLVLGIVATVFFVILAIAAGSSADTYNNF